jgi:hypothetical protein
LRGPGSAVDRITPPGSRAEDTHSGECADRGGSWDRVPEAPTIKDIRRGEAESDGDVAGPHW